MVGNLHEACQEFDRKKQAKKLEYDLAKQRVKSASGKKALDELNKYWDYKPGMFNHLN